jgi:hypothetical protein
MNFYDVIFAQQKTKTDSKYFGEISDAINVLAGTETTYTPSEMAPAIIDVIPTETASGNPIHITDAAAYPAESVVTTLEPVQEGNGDPSPENVRPITGHTGVELTRTGKNLFDINSPYIANKYIDANGNYKPSSGSKMQNIYTTPIYVNAGSAYTISGNTSETTGVIRIAEYNENGTYIKRTLSLDSENPILTFTTTNTTAYVIVNPDTVITNIQLEVGSTATTYEPYTSETHTVTFPQEQSPVYGCEVDWVNGVLRVTDANIASYNGETLPAEWISDRDVYAEGTTPSIGAQVVYELATPIEISLTPEVITLLKGENNIWTDAGTSEIEYKVDLQTYLDELTTEQASQSSQSLNLSPLNLRDNAEINDVSEDAT